MKEKSRSDFVHRPGKRLQLRALNLSLDDVRRIYLRLAELVSSEGDREIAQISKPEDKTGDQFRTDMATLKRKPFALLSPYQDEMEKVFSATTILSLFPRICQALSALYI